MCTSSLPKSAADSASSLTDSANAAMVTTFALSNWSGLRCTFTFTSTTVELSEWE